MNGEHVRASTQTSIQPIIAGNIQAIDQALAFLMQLSDSHYVSVQTPYVNSSIGQHMRHIVDVFFAVTRRIDPSLIDYDLRRRGADIETSREIAIRELNEVRDWMVSYDILPGRGDDERIAIRTEVMLQDTLSVEIESSIVRELVFASSHAVHHFALISVIAKLQGVKLDESFGLAPATASFLRNEAKEDEAYLECAQ